MEKQNNISQTKWAVILCGGRGSRMGESTHDIPKPLIKIHGKPIMWYTFRTLYAHGFRNFILPLGYKDEMIDTSIAFRMYQVINFIPDNTL